MKSGMKRNRSMVMGLIQNIVLRKMKTKQELVLVFNY